MPYLGVNNDTNILVIVRMNKQAREIAVLLESTAYRQLF